MPRSLRIVINLGWQCGRHSRQRGNTSEVRQVSPIPLHATNNPQLTQPTAAQEEHELEYQHPHVRPTIRSPGSGNGGRGYGLILDTQENENFVPHPVSPLRASDEYDRHVPMPETSPSQQYRGSNDTNVLVDDSQYHDSYPKPQPRPQPGWPEGAKEHMWTPIWLTKSVLLIFAAWFAAMMLATGLLYHFSVVHDGISAQKETNHYGWKYGPTACECCLMTASCGQSCANSYSACCGWRPLEAG